MASEQEELNDIRLIESEIEQNINDITNSFKTKSIVVSKMSTRCGPSPERELTPLVERFISEPNKDFPSDKIKISTGTSPPPQSISTQVKMKIIFLLHYLNCLKISDL